MNCNQSFLKKLQYSNTKHPQITFPFSQEQLTTIKILLETKCTNLVSVRLYKTQIAVSCARCARCAHFGESFFISKTRS